MRLQGLGIFDNRLASFNKPGDMVRIKDTNNVKDVAVTSALGMITNAEKYLRSNIFVT
jgi:hypothetical protein